MREKAGLSHGGKDAAPSAKTMSKDLKTINPIFDMLWSILVICVALLLRWSLSYHPYSGEGKPPMFGDYEAQRHWQEVTSNLPIKQWYSNSSDNDLQYWGLDYPPLTAYHSFLLGHVARFINPEYVELHNSRGYESAAHKYFMRLTVLVADLAIFIPAVLCYTNLIFSADSKSKRNEIYVFKKKDFLLATILFYPGLILIDHGHFQYNCVSLGFFVAAVTKFFQGSMAFGSFLFVLALNYKQMELYHALPCFFYILGINSLGRRKPALSCLRSLIGVSMTVIVIFALIWAPFLTDKKTFTDAVTRLFPLTRGIFEDKVANFWCSLNVVYKLRDNFSNLELAQGCLVSTTVALLPSCFDLYFRPLREKFLLALINTSLAFFLFSFQVHEKSILLVAVPVLLHFHRDPFPCLWFLLISVFSMLPLLIKDGLFLAYCATMIFYTVCVSWMWFDEGIKEEKSVIKKAVKKHVEPKSFSDHCFKILFVLSMIGVVILSFVSKFLVAPKKYPDLFALLISSYSCGHLILFFIYFTYKQFCIKKSSSTMKMKMS